MSERIDGKTLDEWKKGIDAMSQEDMARLWRNTPVGGSPIFNSRAFDGKLFAYFKKRFGEKGGMTPSVSKKIGW